MAILWWKLRRLQSEDPQVRRRAAAALGETSDPRAVGPLIGALKDKDWDVQRAAAKALGKIGSPAVESLIAALKDISLELQIAVSERATGRVFGGYAAAEY